MPYDKEGRREEAIRYYRAIWISDVHLGFRGCQAERLQDFLAASHSPVLYLVGDIVDLWAMRKSKYWPEQHTEVIRLLLDKAQQGTEVIYIPGNHDDAFRRQVGLTLGHVMVRMNMVHVGADGRRFLVLHGDEYDAVVQGSPFVAFLGMRIYNMLLRLNPLVNRLRRLFGYGYWSLSAYLKHKVKNAVKFLSDYQKGMVQEARRQGLDGVICGHIHHAELCTVSGLVYGNCGDWVESCTALVEHADGTMELLRWAEQAPFPASQPSTHSA